MPNHLHVEIYLFNNIDIEFLLNGYFMIVILVSHM